MTAAAAAADAVDVSSGQETTSSVDNKIWRIVSLPLRCREDSGRPAYPQTVAAAAVEAATEGPPEVAGRRHGQRTRIVGLASWHAGSNAAYHARVMDVNCIPWARLCTDNCSHRVLLLIYTAWERNDGLTIWQYNPRADKWSWFRKALSRKRGFGK